MAFKKLGNRVYIADAKEDLRGIKGEVIGAKCYIIKDACEYILMSTGEWIKQCREGGAIAGDYATEEYVNEAIQQAQPNLSDYAKKNEVPSIEGLASNSYVDGKIEGVLDNPVFAMMSGKYPTTEAYGIRVDNVNETIVQAMEKKGLGMYSFWIQKGNNDLPEAVKSKASSTRGICSVGTVDASTKQWHGWILMIDHDGELYVRYIRRSVPTAWKHVVTE